MRPEIQRDINQQQNIEAGMMYEPEKEKGEYLSEVAMSGGDPSRGAAKEIGSTLKDKEKQDLEERKLKIRERNAELRAIGEEFKMLNLGYRTAANKDRLRKQYNSLSLQIADDIDKTKKELREAQKGTEQEIFDRMTGKYRKIYVPDADSEDKVADLSRTLRDLENQQRDFKSEWTKMGTPVERPRYTPKEPVQPKQPSRPKIPLGERHDLWIKK